MARMPSAIAGFATGAVPAIAGGLTAPTAGEVIVSGTYLSTLSAKGLAELHRCTRCSSATCAVRLAAIQFGYPLPARSCCASTDRGSVEAK